MTRIAHIGLGTRGLHWLEIVGKTPGVESVALVEPRLEGCDERDGVPVFASASAALAEIAADAAIVAAPIAEHVALTRACVAAGLAVLVEKPLAPTLGEALALSELGGRVIAGQSQRFCRVERGLRELVGGGIVGRVEVVRCAVRRTRRAADLADLDYAQLLEDAVHHFDSLRSILGSDAASVRACCFNPTGSDYRHGAATQALIEMRNGVHVQYSGSLVANGYSYTWWIEGDAGVLWSDRKRILFRPRGSRWFRPARFGPVPPADASPYPQEGTGSLLAALVGGEAETALADNLQTLAMVEASRIADRESREVDVGALLDRRGAGQ